jgi:hypothetical protein
MFIGPDGHELQARPGIHDPGHHKPGKQSQGSGPEERRKGTRPKKKETMINIIASSHFRVSSSNSWMET